MRGNWETAEALVLAPGQQQLPQQQQNVMDEQRLPLHSPTTPAWGGITDRIVKEEPVEDKNDDSGVSPGHYTSNSVSPRSRRSSSTANCSLSPGSATSQDSNAMHCGSFDYSPPSIYKNCESPLAYGRLHTMDEVTQHQINDHQAMNVVSNSLKPTSDESEICQDTLQCPVCPFSSSNRLQFSEHLAAHYATNCDTPELTKSLLTTADSHNQQLDQQQQQQQHFEQMDHSMSAIDEENRASPSQSERSEQESEEADEPGLRVPRVNSQGKVKTFRCKQCNFVAITKLEFWEHTRGHIKAEKLLTCPKCPFVTEYKHHLEYHLRNHFGSKPFKCDKCSYSCVNKSMLNSHLKSHSNVYQYRCANCSYATKYCHSLKLHLRKYKHNPAMVLNADGSPNPLPIIDVYGTRRGPKQKSSSGANGGKTNDDNSAQMPNGGVSNKPGQLLIQPQLSPISHNGATMNPMDAIHALSNSVNQGVMSFPYGQLFAGFSMPANRYQLTDDATDKHLENLKTNFFAEYAKMMANDRTNAEYSQDIGTSAFGTSATDNDGPKVTEMAMSPSDSESGQPSKDFSGSSASRNVPDVSTENVKFTPLDLSKPDVMASESFAKTDLPRADDVDDIAILNTGKIRKSDFHANNNNHSKTNNNLQSDGTSSIAHSPKTAGTSRRKGRAVKFERRVIVDDVDEASEKMPDGRDSAIARNDAAVGTIVDNSKETTPDRNFSGVGMNNEFTCQYCEIAFGNVVMYTVHMGYHGYKDPFTCNMCGHECDDKLSFFLHIARSKHS